MVWRNPTLARLLLGLSLFAFLAFDLVGRMHMPSLGGFVAKGASVGLLAILALREGQGRDGRLLALVMALGALGDVVIEFMLEAGAAVFLLGHLVAIALYRANRRESLSSSQRLLALVVLIVVPVLGWVFTHALTTVLYALALSAMAASAWTSRFSRYTVGLGAMLFVASDLLIFARLGPLAESPLPGMLIWPLYYLGQLMICTGLLKANAAAR
jgi:uncharacterized membrane protein YhhN